MSEAVAARWAKAPEALPVLGLEFQPLLAIICGLLLLLSIGSFLTVKKDQSAKIMLSALVASIATGFGSVFLVNAVHVYTG